MLHLDMKAERNLRVTLTCPVFFRAANNSEILRQMEENCGRLNNKEFIRIYDLSTIPEFGFLAIDFNKPNEIRHIQNFDTVIPVVEQDVTDLSGMGGSGGIPGQNADKKAVEEKPKPNKKNKCF